MNRELRCGDRVRKSGGLAVGSTGIVQKVDPDGLLVVEWDVLRTSVDPICNEGVTTRTAPELVERQPRRVRTHVALPGGWSACLIDPRRIVDRRQA